MMERLRTMSRPMTNLLADGSVRHMAWCSRCPDHALAGRLRKSACSAECCELLLFVVPLALEFSYLVFHRS